MVHVGALPGTPHAREGLDAIVRRAAGEARVLARAGFDAVMIENMHDRPYVNGPHEAHVVSCMTRIALAVRDEVGSVVLGVQVLSLGHKEALAVALASGATFIRVENFVYAHVADEGLMPTAVAGELLRYRRTIGGTGVAILADVKKKHASHAITGDVSIAEAARAAEFFGADGVVVTGSFTGEAPTLDDVEAVRAAVRIPVLVGSGVTTRNAAAFRRAGAGAIVGSWIKRGGVWSNTVDGGRCRSLVKAWKED
jgi:membrane complex biogenesis BtpA family protein